MAALLGQVGGGQIGDDPPRGQGQTDPGEGAAHPLAAFSHRLVRQADDVEHRLLILADQLDLDVHAPRLDPVKSDRNDSRDHGSAPLFGARNEP